MQPLYEYCDSITISFIELRTREDIADLYFRQRLGWNAADKKMVQHGRPVSFMERTRCPPLYVAENNPETGNCGLEIGNE